MRPLIGLLFLSTLAACASPSTAEVVPLDTDEQKTLYALGLALSRQLAQVGFTEADVRTIEAGLADGILGREARVDLQDWGPKIDGMIQTRMAATMETEKQESLAYCDKRAAEEGAQKTASGAIYFETLPGSGESPSAADSVKVHYHGTLRDGTVFDSSVDRGEPVTFSLDGVIACFSEGIQKMRVGGKATLVCPSDAAYGDRGSAPLIKPGAAINFEIELIEIVKAS